MLPIPRPTPAQLLVNGISQKLVIYSPKDLIEEKLAAYLKSMLSTANSECLKLMLTNVRFISEASISLVPDGAQDVCVNHSDDSFLGRALACTHCSSAHLLPDGSAGCGG